MKWRNIIFGHPPPGVICNGNEVKLDRFFKKRSNCITFYPRHLDAWMFTNNGSIPLTIVCHYGGKTIKHQIEEVGIMGPFLHKGDKPDKLHKVT